MDHPQKFVSLLEKLIRDGHRLLEAAYGGNIQDRDGLRKWSNELILFRSIGGNLLAPWSRRLLHNGVVIPVGYLQAPLAALETIHFAIEEGLLNSYRNLVMAEAFSDLFQQGEHLLAEGYYLAAGVVFRAVLEEKLRELCTGAGCMPEKDRPTIGDLNQALYKCESAPYDKTMMLNVTALAAVGNNAAHNIPSLQKEDVERLMGGVLEFISRYAPS